MHATHQRDGEKRRARSQIDQTLLRGPVVGMGFLRLPHGDCENVRA